MQGVWHTGIVVYGKEGLGQSKPAYMPALPCRPFFAVAELPDWLARACIRCIRPFRHAEKISQSQGVISSISIIILPLVPFPITSPLSHCWQKDWTTEPHTATYTMSGVLLWWRHFLWHSSKHWLWHAKAQMRDSRWFVASFQIYNLIVAKVFWLKIHDIAEFWVAVCLYLKVLCLDLRLLGIFSHLPGITSGMTTKTSKYRLPAFICNKIQHMLLIHPP